jgi:hypothetical protein
MQFLIALDQLVNALLDGWADETLSARSYRERLRCEWWINLLFFPQKNDIGKRNHCEQCYYHEKDRKDLPPEYRCTPKEYKKTGQKIKKGV